MGYFDTQPTKEQAAIRAIPMVSAPLGPYHTWPPRPEMTLTCSPMTPADHANTRAPNQTTVQLVAGLHNARVKMS